MDQEIFGTGQIIRLRGVADSPQRTAAENAVSVVALTVANRASSPGKILQLFPQIVRFKQAAKRPPLSTR